MPGFAVFGVFVDIREKMLNRYSFQFVSLPVKSLLINISEREGIPDDTFKQDTLKFFDNTVNI